MSKRVQRVLVIQQDASEELSTRAVRWALDVLSLDPGDKMTLFGINQPFRTAAITSTTMGCGILFRYRRKLDSSATLKRKQELVDQELAKKLDEYQNNPEIKEILKLCELKQIEFEITMEIGHSVKEVTVQAARKMEATCVILDRQMKKDRKYFMENLSCGILRLKHDNRIEYLREPKAAEINIMTIEKGQSSHDGSTDEMIHRIHEEHLGKPETSCKRKWEESISEKSICSVCNNRRPEIGLKEFTYAELKAATNSFSPQNLISKGGKEVYRGQLSDGMQIVVTKHTFFANMVAKHHLTSIKQEEFNMIWKQRLTSIKVEEFKTEVQMLAKARHANVAMLLGSCSEDGHRLLVYEYVCNGSLDQHLSKENRVLTWEGRMKIAIGVAKGLQYLHRNSIYGIMRPNNILLTHEQQPLLANFGLTRNQYEESDHSSGTSIMTTFEYVAPEYEETGKHSSKSDVYSFGVVLLELITGPRTIEDTNGQSFLRWARPLLKEMKYGDLIDPGVLDSHDLYQFVWMVRVAEKCLNWKPDRRLSINKVVETLTSITQGYDVKDFSPPESDCSEQITR